MRYRTLMRLLFIVYCVEAGLFLVIAPWSANWDRALIQVPYAWLRGVGLDALTRSAVSGFGLVHLAWGANDLEGLLSRWGGAGRNRSTG